MNLLHQPNMIYKLVVFDFDGTIADTSPGIIDSHIYALKAMGRETPDKSVLLKVIGGQLIKIYIENFGFEEKLARKAVKIYRDRYAEKGIHMATLYPGFKELLIFLKSKGYRIGVATLKAEKFAKEMLNELEIAEYFDIVCGMDDNDQLTKADLIKKCSRICSVSTSEMVLIGDSINDWRGATAAEVKFIGVTYGFGFKQGHLYDFDIANTVEDLTRFF